MFLDAKRDMFICQKLEEHHAHNGHQLGKQLIDAQYVDEDVENKIAEQHATNPNGEEDGKPAFGVVFYFEVERAIQREARDYSHYDAGAIGKEVMNLEDTNQQGVDAKIEAGGAAAYDSIEDEVVETAKELSDYIHTIFLENEEELGEMVVCLSSEVQRGTF